MTPSEEAQLLQTIEMFEVITQSQPLDCQSLEILKEAYVKLNRQNDLLNTSKRIAQAYVQLGQLSSAILEYEGILQHHPGEADVLAALADIESRANSVAARPGIGGATDPGLAATGTGRRHREAHSATDVDDGRGVMHKLFVDGRMIAESDFNTYWPTTDLSEPPRGIQEPFLLLLHEKGIVPIEKSIKLVCERARLAYLPLEKYDVDVELARSFPRDVCQRWCLLPFDRMSKSVLVATANPFNRQAIWELENATKNRLLWYVCSPVELMKIARKTFR